MMLVVLIASPGIAKMQVTKQDKKLIHLRTNDKTIAPKRGRLLVKRIGYALGQYLAAFFRNPVAWQMQNKPNRIFKNHYYEVNNI